MRLIALLAALRVNELHPNSSVLKELILLPHLEPVPPLLERLVRIDPLPTGRNRIPSLELFQALGHACNALLEQLESTAAHGERISAKLRDQPVEVVLQLLLLLGSVCTLLPALLALHRTLHELKK